MMMAAVRGLTQKLVDTPGITKRGGNPFMEVAAREKSTGKKNSFTLGSDRLKAFSFFMRLLSSAQLCWVCFCWWCFCASCRKDLLEQLKRQMEEKCDALKLQLATKAAEAQFLRQSDHLALSGDAEQRQRHKEAMTAYRDENKRVRAPPLSHMHNVSSC